MNQSSPIIVAENLTKKFGSFVANDNLSFSVGKGEIFGFLGANGAGKTTAIRILCGLLTPTSGKVTVNGCDVYTQSELIKKQIGYMSQKFSLYPDLTVYENFRFYGGVYGLSSKKIIERVDQLLENLHLKDYRNTLIKNLPQGLKQRLAFAVSVIHEPDIVFLDEPTSGVDPIVRRQFWDLIYRASDEGTTVFVTTHYMDEAEYCQRLCIMSEGKIESIGSPKELKELYKADSIEEVFLRIARNNYK
jgi:ABC-2 type transport system ATP-binding protein